MKEITKAVNGFTAPIEQLLALIKDNETEMSALDVTALCKQIEVLTGVIADTLKAKANREYLALVGKDAAVNQWDVLGGQATIAKYGARATWSYPALIVKQELALAAAKKEAQANETAKKLTPMLDPDTSTMFSVSLKNMPVEPVAPKMTPVQNVA